MTKRERRHWDTLITLATRARLEGRVEDAIRYRLEAVAWVRQCQSRVPATGRRAG